MKKRLLLLALILILPIVQANDFGFDSAELIMNTNIHTELEVIPESGSFNLNSVTLHLTYFPRENWQQEVISMNSPKTYSLKEDSLIFNWNNPSSPRIPVNLNARINTKNDLIKIKEKINFPLSNIDQEIEQYILPTQNIESDNPKIIALASSLVAGQDDEYYAVFEIFNWVRDNINYSLNSLTVSSSQPSSWVLENRYGVCDELNSLFISLVRSVGIPARYVSGLAFTNYNDMNQWGAHGWAEIYFPEYGWVPFDVTYGQYAFVDSTHIILKTSVDSNESSIRYEWTGRDVELKADPMTFDVSVAIERGIPEKLIYIELSPFKTKTDFGSYNIIEANIKNLKNYYVATDIRLTRTEGIESVSKETQYIVLKPNQEKKIYWLIKVTDDLDIGHSYKFPIGVISTRAEEGLTSYDVATNYYYYSLKTMSETLEGLREEEQLTYSKNIAIDCTLEESSWYEYETRETTCDFRNTGNVVLNKLDACFDEDCRTFNLGIARTERIIFPIDSTIPGEYESKISVRNQQVSRTINLKYEILDLPSVDIIDYEFPIETKYEGEYELKFTVKKTSASQPENIKIIVNSKLPGTFEISDLNDDRNFVLGFEGKHLNYGVNNITIDVLFSDSNEREYFYQEGVIISLTEATFIQRVMIHLQNAEIWLEKQLYKINQ